MNKEVVKELIQDEMNAENIKNALKDLLFDPERKRIMLEDFSQLKKLLYTGGSASENAALQIKELLKV